MANDNKSVGWKLWIQWVLANVISVGIGLRIADSAEKLTTRNVIQDHLFPVLGVILAALVIAIGQWIVLRHYGISIWWIPVTAIGALLGSSGLLLASIPQSIILWHRTHWAGLWIVAHIPAYLIYQAFWFELSRMMPDWAQQLAGGSGVYAVQVIIGVISAVFSGWVLVWLLRNPKLKNTSPSE